MSGLEDALVFGIKAIGLPYPEREFRFAPPRRWRFDLAWPQRKLSVEVEGGTWVQGRHTRGAGMRGDCEKYNAAVLDGWRVLRFTSDMIRDGSALGIVERALR
jgi:hypothetical protein